MVTKEEFRSAMSKFATGVTVVTTLDEQGQPHAMTANSFTSVCLDPPTILICVAHTTHTYSYLEETQRFGINILYQDQEELGAYFARRPEDRVGNVEYSYAMTDEGVPILEGSMVSFTCKVVGAHVYGDHTVYMGEVKKVRQKDSGAPLMFYLSRWYNPTNNK